MKDLAVAGTLLVLTTLVASNLIRVPHRLIANPILTVGLVIASLLAFTRYPVVGIVLFLLTAVLFFKRNLSTMAAVYGEKSIVENNVADAPHGAESASSGPRQYDQFQETDSANPMIGPIVEGFEPAPYGDEAGAPVDGQFPLQDARVESGSVEGIELAYKPAPDMGSNEFERIGPNIDEKHAVFGY
jgi:hypothetical protein